MPRISCCRLNINHYYSSFIAYYILILSSDIHNNRNIHNSQVNSQNINKIRQFLRGSNSIPVLNIAEAYLTHNFPTSLVITNHTQSITDNASLFSRFTRFIPSHSVLNFASAWIRFNLILNHTAFISSLFHTSGFSNLISRYFIFLIPTEIHSSPGLRLPLHAYSSDSIFKANLASSTNYTSQDKFPEDTILKRFPCSVYLSKSNLLETQPTLNALPR